MFWAVYLYLGLSGTRFEEISYLKKFFEFDFGIFGFLSFLFQKEGLQGGVL